MTDKNLELRFDAFNPIRRHGSTRVLEYATSSDLLSGGLYTGQGIKSPADW